MRIEVGCGPMGPNYTYEPPPTSFFLAPRAVEPSAFIEVSGIQAVIDHGFNPVGLPPPMFVWGRATYDDVFGKPHWIEWCYQIRPERHARERMTIGFVQWGEHNRSDD
jgi:hypothetical protein